MTDRVGFWYTVSLAECAQIIMGQSPDSSSYNELGNGLAFFQGKAEFGLLNPRARKWCTSPTKIAESNDILLSVRAPVGPSNLATETCCIGRGLAAIRAYSPIDQKFLFYQIRAIEPWLSEQGTGTTFKAISGDFIRSLEVSIAPLNEQKRIADKLDQTLAIVERAKARLARVPEILKQFRQSILAAATDGRLTEDWRTEYRVVTPWRYDILRNVANIIDPHPSHRTPKEVAVGIPYIGIGDLNNEGQFDFVNARKVSREVFADHQNRYTLNKGDFIFGKIGTLGRATMLPIGFEYTLSANVILIQPQHNKIESLYLMFVFQAPQTINEINIQSKSTSQAAFGIKKMREFPVMVPSFDEQHEIVRRVETLFALADRIEARYKAAAERVDKLTLALLAKAFRGELVPQDPADEPAAVLLERIRAEREAAARSKPPRGRKIGA